MLVITPKRSTPMATRTNRTERVALRLTLRAERTLAAAAAASQRTVSDFVLESALLRADEVLSDRQILSLGAVDWRALNAALDAPPEPAARLARLLREPGSRD